MDGRPIKSAQAKYLKYEDVLFLVFGGEGLGEFNWGDTIKSVEGELAGAYLEGESLVKTDFSHAVINSVNFMDADFGLDNLGGSTSLYGANFTNATLRYAVFSGAEYDSCTIFPKGFNSKQHVVIYLEEAD